MKTASRILLTFGLLVFFTGTTFSQVAATENASSPETKSVTASPGKFVDTNKNGICDNHEAKVAGGQGRNFVDKDGDGKCDNCGCQGNCKGNGNCVGNGNCCHKGQCCGEGKGAGKGNCCGQRHQHRHGCIGQGGDGSGTKPNK